MCLEESCKYLSPFLFIRCKNIRLRSSSLWCFSCNCFRRKRIEQSFYVFAMPTTIRGIYRGFKFITQIFAVKDREMEMEIGYPTDVKHVSHIGWDDHSGKAPSWMNEFKTGPDFASKSIANSGSSFSPWSSQDFGERLGRQTASDMFTDIPPTDMPNIPKKQKHKKHKSASSTKSSTSSMRSRLAMLKA